MSSVPTPSSRRLVLVESAHRGGIVLERALTARGWTVTRSESAGSIALDRLAASDALLLALDDDDAAVFELLLGLSSQPQRPTVVLMTRRADAAVLRREVLAALGVDHITGWPARLDQLETALEAARREHEPERYVS